MGEYSWANSKKVLEITKRDEGVLIFKSHVRIIEGKKKKKLFIYYYQIKVSKATSLKPW